MSKHYCSECVYAKEYISRSKMEYICTRPRIKQSEGDIYSTSSVFTVYKKLSAEACNNFKPKK